MGFSRSSGPQAGIHVPTELSDEMVILEAISDGSLEIRYEAQFDQRTQSIVAAVAALTSTDRPLGVGGDLVRFAVEQGWEHLLLAHLLTSACLQMGSWLRQKQPPERIVVPVRAPQLFGPLFVDGVQQALRRADLAPERLEIEIPEGAAADYPGAVFALLRQLKAMGLSITVNGFGTSHLSLAYLGRDLIDRVKIDHKVVAGARHDARAIERLLAVIAVARNLGIEIAADGVDTEAERSFLVDLGCVLLQGSLFGLASADPVIA